MTDFARGSRLFDESNDHPTRYQRVQVIANQ